MSTAADLNKALDPLLDEIKAANSKRQELTKAVHEVIARARQALIQLGEREIPFPRRGRPARPANKAVGRRRKRRVSAEARAKMAAAQRARWAKVRAAGKKR
jgi:hypothetical protein